MDENQDDAVKRAVQRLTGATNAFSGEFAEELRGHVGTLSQRVELLEAALKRIAAWDNFPRVPDRENPGETISYGYAYGSNGERDYMRKVARDALAGKPAVLSGLQTLKGVAERGPVTGPGVCVCHGQGTCAWCKDTPSAYTPDE